MVVGADRIAANGDVANKIGTYSVAVLARENGLPFYVAAPVSTFDLARPTGAAIPIEERSPDEVTHHGGRRLAPVGVGVRNPAFDVTPAPVRDRHRVRARRGAATLRGEPARAGRPPSVSVLLAIETSCDETAAAVVAEDGAILANVVSTQVAIHAPYGGVVPELASRHHIENIIPVVRRAMAEAGLDFPALEAVAVTQGPGLIGSLLVGLQVAKGIAFVHGKPLVPVHHIAGHLQAPFLAHPDISLPALALVVSGGHTSLFEVPAPGALPPARPHARRRRGRGLRQGGEAPRPGLSRAGRSSTGSPGAPTTARSSSRFAGSRTASPTSRSAASRPRCLLHVRRQGIVPVPEGEDAPPVVRDLVASFQRAVVSALLRGLERAAIAQRPQSLLLTGGVAANLLLRTEAERLAARLGLPLYMPPIELSTDNAAMIGAAGFLALRRGDRLGWDANAAAQMPLA